MTEDSGLWNIFSLRAGVDTSAAFEQVVQAVNEIPYGRPSRRTPEGVVDEWRGTCSTKHALLVDLAREHWPEPDVRVMHRIYRLTPSLAASLLGLEAAEVVPPEGVIDVHTYVTALIDGRPIALDVTFPGSTWDGRSDMTLACGEGLDVDGGEDPWTLKAALVSHHCDAGIRDSVISALEGARRSI